MKLSTVFHVSHYFLDGVNLTGGTPLVEWVECLGVAGTLSPFSVIGWGASVEMIGLVAIPTLLPLSSTVGGVTLPIGVTGNCESTFLYNNGTHWKSHPLESSNVQGHCSVFP